MKNFLISIVFFFVFSAIGAAQISQGFWLYGTQVKLVNATEDGKPSMVQLGTKEAFVPAGESRVFVVGRGIFATYPDYTTLTAAAQVCDSVSWEANLPFPPAWAADPRSAGENALNSEYLSGDPGKKEVKKRIDELKKLVKGKFGEKERRSELDHWFRRASREGLGGVQLPACQGYAQAQSMPLTVYHAAYNNRRDVITLFVRGSRQRGYYIAYY